MTIETATPSSAETIAALFDTLVDAVAKRVQAELVDNITAQLDHAMDTWAMNSMVLEDKVEASVQTAIDALDLHDQVLEIAQDLTFEVSVSR